MQYIDIAEGNFIMNKTIKSILSLMVCFSLLNLPIIANENEKGDEPIGQINGISEEGLKYMQSAEYKENIRLKKENAKAMGLTTQRATTKKLTIDHYTQSGKYDCGPASAQIVIKYHTGTKYALSYLGGEMGTSDKGTNVDSLTLVLVELSGKPYEFSSTINEPFYDNMVTDINGNAPVIYDVDAHFLNTAYAEDTGHYVVGMGYGPGRTVYYYDVNPGFDDEWAVSEADMERALTEHSVGYYVW